MNTQYALEIEAEHLLKHYFPNEVVDIMVTCNPYKPVEVIERIVEEASYERER